MPQFVRRFWKTIVLVVLVSSATLLLNILVSSWLSSFHNLHLPSFGTIHVIGVEAFGGNLTATEDGSQVLDWGAIYPGIPATRLFYVKSKSNRPITLQLTVLNLTFQNSKGAIVTELLPFENPLNLTWNYTGAPLEPGEQICLVLTLEASSDPRFIWYIIDNDMKQFSFVIVIKPLEM
ncbi:MAG: hypothetical protein QXR01_03635 [Candidatus Bathyarchaeia archaeon]